MKPDLNSAPIEDNMRALNPLVNRQTPVMHNPHFYRFGVLQILLVLAFCTGPVRAEEPIDFSHLATYAQLSEIAYRVGADLGEDRLPAGYSLTEHGVIENLEIGYLVATDGGSGDLVIAVRGTENVNNALVDISFKLLQDELAGIKLHRGFAAAAQAIYRKIRPTLDRNQVIHSTGHSLGGAVALILGMYLDRDGYQVGEIVTFGQPKVTNLGGSRAFKQLDVLRIVAPLDMVPLVPPLDILDINDLDVYWHLGREIVLNTDQTYSVLQGADAMLRATRFTQRLVDQQNLDHHRMSVYRALLQSKTSDASEVPFQHSLNLFNLFGKPAQ